MSVHGSPGVDASGSDQSPMEAPPLRPLLLGLAAAGLGTLAAGLATSTARSLGALLAASFVAVAACVGALALLALFHVSNAGFHVTFKRVLEGLAAALPVGGLGLLLLLPGAPSLWRWARTGADHDPVIAAKGAFLSLPAFALRMVLFLGLWLLFAFVLRSRSRQQDADADVRHTQRSAAFSAVFLLLGGYTVSLASVDWLMSTDPRFASTIFGFYTIGSVLLTGTAATLVAVVSLKRAGRLQAVTEHHLHDLGKLLFAFSTLWAYLWFSQYLLIWYANLPEETAWILARTRGGWAPLFYGNVVIGWVLPFLLLLPKPAKRSRTHLFNVALLVLLGRFLDTWLLVGPSNQPQMPGLPWIELGALVGVGALVAIVFERTLVGAPLLPKNDPYLVEALHHRT